MKEKRDNKIALFIMLGLIVIYSLVFFIEKEKLNLGNINIKKSSLSSYFDPECIIFKDKIIEFDNRNVTNLSYKANNAYVGSKVYKDFGRYNGKSELVYRHYNRNEKIKNLNYENKYKSLLQNKEVKNDEQKPLSEK